MLQCVFIYPSVNTKAASTFCYWVAVDVRIQASTRVLAFHSLAICLETEFLDHMPVPFWILEKCQQWQHHPPRLPPLHMFRFIHRLTRHFPCPFSFSFFCDRSAMPLVWGGWLIKTFLATSDIKHLFMQFLVTCRSSPKKCQPKSFAHLHWLYYGLFITCGF